MRLCITTRHEFQARQVEYTLRKGYAQYKTERDGRTVTTDAPCDTVRAAADAWHIAEDSRWIAMTFATEPKAMAASEVDGVVDQPCAHGDYRSCVVDGCRPLQLVHVPGVLVPPPPPVACMWCGGDSERGQCGPCALLLDAIQAAPAAGIAAIIAQVRARDGVLDLAVELTASEVTALKIAHEYVRVHMAHQHPWAIRDDAMIALGKLLAAVETAKKSSAA